MHVLALRPGSTPAVAVALHDKAAHQLAELWLEPNSSRRQDIARWLLTHEPSIAIWATVQFLVSHCCWPHDLSQVAEELANGVLRRGDGLHPDRAGSSGEAAQWYITEEQRHRWGRAAAELLFLAELTSRCYSRDQADEVRFWTAMHRGIQDWILPVDGIASIGGFASRQVEAWCELVQAVAAQDSARQHAAEATLEEGFSGQVDKIAWLRNVATHIAASQRQTGQLAEADWAAVLESWSATSLEPNLFLNHLLGRLQWADQLDRRFQDTLLQAKLEALAEFAYGASHELNNPLANITMRAESLLAEETHPERRRKLATICTQALRASEMISDLMLFARPPAIQWQRVAVRPLAEQVADELRQQATSQGTQLLLHIDQSAPSEIWADPVQVAVALKAVCTNALEALGSGGCIKIDIRVPENEQHHGQPLAMEIAVRDNGPGLSPRALRHMFDPFFSGREAGRGLGLGLSKCWRIMSLHGGTIRVESSGLGTTVRLLFPHGRGMPPPQPITNFAVHGEADGPDCNQ